MLSSSSCKCFELSSLNLELSEHVLKFLDLLVVLVQNVICGQDEAILLLELFSVRSHSVSLAPRVRLELEKALDDARVVIDVILVFTSAALAPFSPRPPWSWRCRCRSAWWSRHDFWTA